MAVMPNPARYNGRWWATRRIAPVETFAIHMLVEARRKNADSCKNTEKMSTSCPANRSDEMRDAMN